MVTELELMDHATGSGKNKMDTLEECYRNYFAAGPDDEDEKIWKGLVEKGWAIKSRGPRDYMPYNIYHVTEEGWKELKDTDLDKRKSASGQPIKETSKDPPPMSDESGKKPTEKQQSTEK